MPSDVCQKNNAVLLDAKFILEAQLVPEEKLFKPLLQVLPRPTHLRPRILIEYVKLPDIFWIQMPSATETGESYYYSSLHFSRVLLGSRLGLVRDTIPYWSAEVFPEIDWRVGPIYFRRRHC